MSHKSIKSRILVWSGSILFMLLLLFSISFYYLLQKNIMLRVEKRLESKAEEIHSKIAQNKIDLTRIETIVPFEILKDGKSIFKSRYYKEEEYAEVPTSNNGFTVINTSEGRVAFYRLNFNNPFKGSIVVVDKESDDVLESILYSMLILMPLIFAFLLLLANSMIDTILNPIKEIYQSANKITVNRLTQELPLPKNSDELRELTEAFNEMIRRLKRGVEQIERFNSDVSHELRTPLTVINAELELALNRRRDAQYYEETLKKVSSQVRNLNDIVETLLMLSRHSKEDIKKTLSYCDLNSLLMEVSESYIALAESKGVKIDFLRFEKVYKNSNPMLIERVFSNIIDNAIKYTPKGGSIAISLYEDTEGVHFIVQDSGVGIDDESLLRITDRFYRVDSSRTKRIKGFGLGLSIVQRAVELLDASMSIESKLNSGTTVHIVF
ncbi:MAG TPA: HAMP domain-containing protein [Nitratifractor sp.]|nr:HAMP domain-containing protein [Nitratifractor sp.]HHH20583.1 HAMP domain-containing protein [Nitratifractor sp.]